MSEVYENVVSSLVYLTPYITYCYYFIMDKCVLCLLLQCCLLMY